MSSVRYWVWLASLFGLRSQAIRIVLQQFGDPMEIYFTPHEKMERVEGLLKKDIELLKNKSLTAADRILGTCEQKHIRVMTMQDADYPCRLTHIYDPPVVLYVRGRFPVIDNEAAIAIVGTRRASPYGIKIGMRLGYEITKGGGLIVSGLAEGVDAAAAKGALNAGGSCVGVLGSAIDVPYPKKNTELIEDVAMAGAVISEYPPGYPTRGENFPRRNRIISGLSVGVTVLEAPARSGALITANCALEQGRELFVVPGNVDSPLSYGSNALLRECGIAVTCGRDVLSEFVDMFPGKIPLTDGIEDKLPADYEKRMMETCPVAPPRDLPQSEADSSGKTLDSEGKTDLPAATKKEIDKENAWAYSDLVSPLEGLTDNQLHLLNTLKNYGEMLLDELIDASDLAPDQTIAEVMRLCALGVVRGGIGMAYSLNITK